MNEVWIVDDDRSIRWVLEKVLTKAGFTCRSFSDGNAAWTALQNDCPGVLISDIRMPGPNGIDLLTRIKEKYPKLPVIITTAFPIWKARCPLSRRGPLNTCRSPLISIKRSSLCSARWRIRSHRLPLMRLRK